MFLCDKIVQVKPVETAAANITARDIKDARTQYLKSNFPRLPLRSQLP